VLLAATVLVSGCGGGSSSDSSTSPKAIDRAFIAQMVAHHQMAIDMAKMAREKASHPEIKTLADAIVAAQQSEIATLRAADTQLEAAGIKPGDLGIPASKAGMDMKTSSLQGAKPFDRPFIDMMVPHHEGAIRMAQVELWKGESPDLKRLAGIMIAAQAREIAQMTAWRKQWFGTASPAMQEHMAHST
jgi:uncharacterized protein (DUF305 family)